MSDHLILISIADHNGTRHVDVIPAGERFGNGDTVRWESQSGKFTIRFLHSSPFKSVEFQSTDNGTLHYVEPALRNPKNPQSNPYLVAIEDADNGGGILVSSEFHACWEC